MTDPASSEDLKTFASWIMGLDRLTHEPSRLAILMLLRRSGADYLFIQRSTFEDKDLEGEEKSIMRSRSPLPHLSSFLEQLVTNNDGKD